MNSTIATIPKERNYKLPEGRYRSQLSGVTVKGGTDESTYCHLHFSNIQIRGMERYDCCARAVFPFSLAPGSQLRVFLERLLGKQFFVERAGEAIDLKTALQGKYCEIELSHGQHDHDRYDWPMVLVTDAQSISEPTTTSKEATPKK